MGLLERTEERGREKKQQKRGRETNTSSMSNSHNFLSSMDRLSASLSTPLGSRTAMEQEFDRKFMAGIKTRGEGKNTFSSSSAGSSLAHQSNSALSTGFSTTSTHKGTTGNYGTSNYSQPSSGRALHQDSTYTSSRSTPTYSPTYPACGKSYKAYSTSYRI